MPVVHAGIGGSGMFIRHIHLLEPPVILNRARVSAKQKLKRSEGPMYSPPHFYYVYIMTNRSKTLYTGVTGYLERRVFEHKQGIKGEFAARYKIDRLVYFERFGDIHPAIARGDRK